MESADQLSSALVAPEGWNDQPLGAFMTAAWSNALAAVANDRQRFDALAEVDGLYRQLISSLGGATERLSVALVMRAHGMFLSAAALGLSGLVAEAYALLRGSLEAGLQGVFVAGAPERQQLWINRNNDDEARAQALREFDGENMLRRLREIDAATAAIYEKLHRRADDHSAHPNTFADIFRDDEPGAPVDVTHEYFVDGGEVQRFCLRSAVQVGICCLSMFFYVFPERYRAGEIAERLAKLRHGH